MTNWKRVTRVIPTMEDREIWINLDNIIMMERQGNTTVVVYGSETDTDNGCILILETPEEIL